MLTAFRELVSRSLIAAAVFVGSETQEKHPSRMLSAVRNSSGFAYLKVVLPGFAKMRRTPKKGSLRTCTSPWKQRAIAP